MRRVLWIGAAAAIVFLAFLLFGRPELSPGPGVSTKRSLDERPAYPAARAGSRTGLTTVDRQLLPATSAHDALSASSGPTYTVRGRVLRDSDGTPLAGVPVYVLPANRSLKFFSLTTQTVSGPDGSFVVPGLEPQDSRQSFVAMGRGWISREAAQPADHHLPALPTAEAVGGTTFRLDLRVVAAARVVGRVLLPDGAPAVGAEVRGLTRRLPPLLMSMRRFTPLDLIEPTRTDAAGRFEISAVGACQGVVLEARLPGYTWTTSPPVRTVLGQDAALEIRLREPFRLVLTVLDGHHGRPLPGAAVRVQCPRSQQGFVNPNDTFGRTDAEGRLVLTPLPRTRLRISVEARLHERWRSRRSSLEEGLREALAAGQSEYHGKIRLDPASEITGKLLLPEGVDPEEFYVELSAVDAPGHERIDRTLFLDAPDGSFAMPVPLSGTYLLSVGRVGDEHGDPPRGWGGSIEAKAGARDVEIFVTRGLAESEDAQESEAEDQHEPVPDDPLALWQVEVVGPLGAPVRNASVSVVASSREAAFYRARGPLQPESSGTGSFRIRVQVGTPGIWLNVASVRLASGEWSAPRLVGPFDGSGGSLTIRVAEGESLSGRVLDLDGTPLQGQSVVAIQVLAGLPSEGGYWCPGFEAEALTDAAGHFTLRRLADADHMLWLCPTPGLVPQAPASVRPGRSEIVLRMKPPVAAWIRLVDGAGTPVVGARVVAYIDREHKAGHDRSRDVFGTTNAEGRCRLDGLDGEATYHLTLRAARAEKTLGSTEKKQWRPADSSFTLPGR